MPREPGVRLDCDRARLRRGLPLLDHGGQPIAVALRCELAVELRDEQPTVREDEDAHRPRRLDEPGRSDRLARGGRMAESVATDRSGVLRGRELFGQRLELLVDQLLELLLLFVQLARLGEAVAVHRLLDALIRGDQLREHARERVDLVAAQLGAGGEARRLLGQHALQSEHEREAHLPRGRRRLAPGLDLGGRLVEGPTPRGALGEYLTGVLAVVEERLARPVLGALGCGDEIVRRRSWCWLLGRFLHVSGALRPHTSEIERRRARNPLGERRLSKHTRWGCQARRRVGAPDSGRALSAGTR